MSDLIYRQAAVIQLSHNKIGDDDHDVIVQKDIETIKQLPSAKPQERKGKWIHDGSHWANRWICDRCKYKLFGVKTKFCPECGQRMEVEHE